MRTASAFVAVGLAVQQAAATGHGWLGADPYSCPSNTDNQCNTEQDSGFKWGKLHSGSSVDHYSGFDFKGYTCQDSFAHSKRGVVLSRGIQSKCIAGTATKDHESNPSFSCSDKSFSIDHVQVSTEEDQDLEFVYGYKNGGTCKHTAACSKSGSTIKNTQCGGADSVTVNVPKDAPKDTCSFGIHSVGFNCGSASVPVPSSTIVPVVSTYAVPSVPIYTVPANSTGQNTPTAPASYPTAPVSTPGCASGHKDCSTIPIYSYSSPVFSYSSPIGTAPVSTYAPVTSPSVPATYPVSSPSVPASSPVSSGSSVVPTSPESTPSSPATYPVESIPVSSGSSVVPTSAESTPSSPATYPAQSYPVGSSSSPASHPAQSYPAGSSAPVTSSLGNSPTEATSSVPGTTAPVYTTKVTTVYTTTCPVTNTYTTSGVTSYETTTTVSTVTTTSVKTYTSVPVTPEASTPATASQASYPATTPEASTPVSTSGNSPIQSSSPVPSAPCPTVLPQCMNTWIKLTTCENNAASDCYCQNSEFTKNVQDCVSSWSYDDNEIQAALSYLAGICAPHISANPGIVTNVPKTITLVPTPATASSPAVTPAPAGASGVTAGPIGGASTPAAGSQPSTVISISKTLTVPVTYSTGASSGSPIPSSSTTTVVNTAVTVPQVYITTGNSPIGASSVPEAGLAAGSPAPVAASPTPTAAGYGAAAASGAGPTGGTTFASVKQVPTAVSSPITPFQGAAVKVGSDFAGVVFAGLISLILLA